MNSVLLYLLQANLFLSLFFVFYLLVLRKDTHFQLNRFFLLASATVSFILPLFEFESEVVPGFILPTLVNISGAISEQETVTESLFTWQNVLYALYACGVLFFLWRFGRSIHHIFRLVRQFGAQSEPTYKVVYLPKDYPTFSFMHYLFWSEKEGDSQREAIKTHELVHIRQRHSFDLVLLEVLGAVCWFNPIVPQIKKQLTLLHEFIADREVIRHSSNQTAYSNLLLADVLGVESLQLTHNFLNQSTIKQRFMMMKKVPSPKWASWKLGLVLPLLGGMIAFVACESNVEALAESDNVTTLNEGEPFEENEAEKMPEFVGGQAMMMKYLANSIYYTDEAKEAGTTGKIYAQFTVTKAGEIRDVNILRGLGHGLDEVVVKVLEEMPNWTPGEQNGVRKDMQLTIPVKFSLEDDSEDGDNPPPPPAPPVPEKE